MRSAEVATWYLQNTNHNLTRNSAKTGHVNFERKHTRYEREHGSLRLVHTYYVPCRSHAVPMPSPAALIHTCRAAPLPFSDSSGPFVKVRVEDGNIRTASPATTLLVTTFVEYRVVAGRSRTQAGCPQAVSGRPMLNSHIFSRSHAALCRGLVKSLSEWHGMGTARARHGMCQSNTAALCKSNGKDN
jgi:hypothetical protein